MQTIDKKIDCIGSRKTCRCWKKRRKNKNVGTSAIGQYLARRRNKILEETIPFVESFKTNSIRRARVFAYDLRCIPALF